MMKPSSEKSSVRGLWLTGVLVVCVLAGFEIRRFFLAGQDWASLLTLSGTITIAMYAALMLCGLAGLILNPVWPDKWPPILERLGLARWTTMAGLFLVVVWFYLYSAWQAVWPGPWTQFLLAAGLAFWVARLARPDRKAAFGLGEFMLALDLFIYPRIVSEVRLISAQAVVYRAVTILGFAFLLFFTFALYGSLGKKIRAGMLAARSRIGRRRFILIAILMTFPLILRFVMGLEAYQLNANIRFAALLGVLWLIAFLLGSQPERWTTGLDLLVGSLALAVSFSITNHSLEILNYPFSLTWSEGNRFYDYSLVFGQSLYQYQGAIVNPYSSPGRYGLWGAAFLIPHLQIWVHRLWDALILTVLPILLGWAVSRFIEHKPTRLIFFLWATLFFMVQSPVHPPFLLALIIALLFGFDSAWWVRVVSLFIASFYAGLSRWTWVVAPASWGLLMDLLAFYPARQGSFWKKLKPTFAILAAGLLPGLILNLGALFTFSEGQSITSHQPLLWYRLLPNPTYPLGVGPATLLTTGPLLIVIAWWLISKRWQTDWLQKLTIFGGLGGFLIVGLIISAKIGGGGDLHNMDMYLAVLILIAALGLMALTWLGEFHPEKWPLAIQALLGLLLILPAISFTPFSSYSENSLTRNLPAPALVSQTLDTIRSEAARASASGEVLFMDQRQLIAFGYITGIPFVPDYEKKYMMDQAMGGNADYFKKYYQDLARRRFSLIISEPLRLKLQGAENAPFSEENDAWVRWVSRPTLCFYKPIFTDSKNNVQLLVPQSNTDACNKYLK